VLVSLPFVAVMIRGVRPYYRITFIVVLVSLPFVAVMIRGVRPYYIE